MKMINEFSEPDQTTFKQSGSKKLGERIQFFAHKKSQWSKYLTPGCTFSHNYDITF